MVAKHSTLLMLAAVWGANIGGMGMLTGTPTNGVLVGMLQNYGFPVSNSFTFLSWMVWGVPLAGILGLVAWTVLVLVFRPGRKVLFRGSLGDMDSLPLSPKAGWIIALLAIAFVLSAAVLSMAMSVPNWQLPVYLITVVWTLIYLCFLFGIKFKSHEPGEATPLLGARDVLHDTPRRGLLWIAIGLAVTGILYLLGFPAAISSAAAKWLRADHSFLLMLLGLGLAVTFTTEVVSNSVIQIAMFVTLFPLSRLHPDVSWQMMLMITLSSSCAFMSPLATPSNGLGYGSSARLSLPYMLSAGFVMNLASAVIITSWIRYVVPLVLSWFA
jgi:sodium-dependent dicarboxylate transporter 2/3/5